MSRARPNRDRGHGGVILAWLFAYRRGQLPGDLTGALTAAALIIPKAMACAVIAGLPIETGLYTALAAMLVYPLFGTSRPLSVSTTTSIAILTGAQIVALSALRPGVEPTAAAATLAMLVGAVFIVARLFRMGFLAKFISAPVLVGFEAGIGIVVLIGQLKYILGLKIEAHGTIETFVALYSKLADTHLLTAAVGVGGILFLFACHRVLPRVPGMLVLVAAGVVFSLAADFGARGMALVGGVPSGLPSLALPDLELVRHLWPAALGIALLSFTESEAAARTFWRKGDPPIDANRELFALGAANLATSVVGGMPTGGGTSQTAAAEEAGVRSQLAQWINALLIVGCLLFLSELMGSLPKTVLAALVIFVAVKMIKPAKFRDILAFRRTEFLWAVVTMAGVILIGTLEGILIAVALSVLTLFYQANHPPVYAVAYNRKRGAFVREEEDADAETFPGLLILRTEGRLTFANAANAGDKMWAMIDKYQPTAIVLECSGIPDIEYTALIALIEAEERIRERGIALYLAAVNPDLMKALERSPLIETLGHERIFPNLFEAANKLTKEAIDHKSV